MASDEMDIIASAIIGICAIIVYALWDIWGKKHG